MAITKENVAEVFTYHAPDETQRLALLSVREAALDMARTILEFTPPCADQQAALRLLRESVHTANSAIALKGVV